MNRLNRGNASAAGGTRDLKRGRPDDGGGRGKGDRARGSAPIRRLDIEEELNRQDPSQRPNHVLMFTVLNATYPIDVNTIYRVCSPHGRVLRIVLFRKDGEPPVNALVEFPDVDTAVQARWNLHGCDIYSGCCTLKVEYARHTKLTVRRNDNMSWDYTDEAKDGSREEEASSRSERRVLLTEPESRREDAIESMSRPGGGSSRDPSGRGMVMNSAAAGMGVSELGMGSTGMSGHGASGLESSLSGMPGLGGMGVSGMVAGMGGMNTGTSGGMMAGMSGVSNLGAVQNLANTLAAIDPIKLAAVISTLTSGNLLNAAAGLGAGGVMGSAGAPVGGMGAGFLAGGSGMTGPIMGGGMMGGPGMAGGMVGDYFNRPQGPEYGDDRGPVVMLYGLEPTKFNCEKLFNLLCVYGNVSRIMFLKNNEGSAMVEMDGPDAVGRVIENLSGMTIFGNVLRADWSRKESVNEVRNPYRLSDGSENYCNFESNRHNRFDTPERAARNRILPPCQELLFFNIPKLDDDELEHVFTDAGAACPVRIKWFPSKGSSKAASGVVQFGSVEEALEALVLCNHTEVEGNKGTRYPYVMKLCFSEGARGRGRTRSRSWSRSRSRSRSRGGRGGGGAGGGWRDRSRPGGSDRRGGRNRR